MTDNELLERYALRIAELMRRVHLHVDMFNYEMDTPNSEAQQNYMNGNCYWYARILQERFSPWFPTEIMYNQIDNHFCCRMKTAAGYIYADAVGVFATGEPDGWVLWKDYITVEPLDAARVYRDCIWHLPVEIWEELPSSFRDAPWDLGRSVITEQCYNQSNYQE